MRESKMPRVLAAALIGLLFGAYKHFIQMKWLAAGRNAYLADQSHYFDRITQTHSTGLTLIAGLILAAVAVGLYEGIAFGFSKVIRPVEVEE